MIDKLLAFVDIETTGLNPDHHEIIPLEKIEDLLLKHKDFMDGICLTGGEPTLHNKKGLLEFIKRIKNLGFLVKFDSNGTSPETLEDLIKQKLILRLIDW